MKNSPAGVRPNGDIDGRRAAEKGSKVGGVIHQLVEKRIEKSCPSLQGLEVPLEGSPRARGFGDAQRLEEEGAISPEARLVVPDDGLGPERDGGRYGQKEDRPRE